MTFRVTINDSFETFEVGTFGEAVRRARRRGLACSIWDDTTQTNWGNKLVGVYCPKKGLLDLRANHGGRAHQQHRVKAALMGNDPWLTALAVCVLIVLTVIIVLHH